MHIESRLLNPVQLNQIQILITPFRWIWHQTEFCLAPNKLEKYNYNVVLLAFAKPNLNCNYTFPIDLARNELPSVVKFIEKV